MTRIGGWSVVQYITRVESAALGAWCMPSVIDPSSSDFPVFPPVRRRSRGAGVVSGTPLPPRHEFPQFPLVRYPPGHHGSTWREDRCATVFRPFFTVFDRFPNRARSGIVRRFKEMT